MAKKTNGYWPTSKGSIRFIPSGLIRKAAEQYRLHLLASGMTTKQLRRRDRLAIAGSIARGIAL